MSRTAISFLLLVLTAAAGCNRQDAARVVAGDGGPPPFEVVPPAIYVAKVKNILVGLPPSDEEVAAVAADATALAGLIDGWMALPEYQKKMLVFFQLAFQQAQIGAGDFADLIPTSGLGAGGQTGLLLQNLKESFARTVLSFTAAGRPLSDAFATHQLMMTPALMELYAFLDVRRVDDAGKVTDLFAQANPKTQITVEAAAGPIAIADSINPASPSFMHWYNANVGKLSYPDASCNVDPIVLPVDAFSLHTLLYGIIDRHKVGAVLCKDQYTNGGQLVASDFSTWKLVTLRAPLAGEAVTRFYDLPTLRSATELVLVTPRVGFFSTPAFAANWPTNSSNQMRVTINQTMIVATGKAFDGEDTTVPGSTPGIDSTHAGAGPDCYGCHQLLDPTRSILSSSFSWSYSPQTDPLWMNQKGLFAFDGVVKPVANLDDFAAALATHPAVAAAWAQKLCYWANSSACLPDDPEFVRVVGKFAQSNLSWSTLVRELLSSPLVTNATETATADQDGEVVGVARRDHLCAALAGRLGLGDICGLDPAATHVSGTVVQIVSGLPSDGYGRGSTKPVLPNDPTLFYRAGLENICVTVAGLVVDGKSNPSLPNLKVWSSKQPDPAIADFVATVMALTASDPRAAAATSILQSHYADAMKSGATAADALRSTFVAACLSPSAIGIGL